MKTRARTVALATLVAVIVTVLGRAVNDTNPLSILAFPGWAISFRLFFGSADSTVTALLSEVAFWLVNVFTWSSFILLLVWLASAMRKRATQ